MSLSPDDHAALPQPGGQTAPTDEHPVPPAAGNAAPSYSSTAQAEREDAAPRRRLRPWMLPAAGALGCVVIGGLLGFGLAKVEWPTGSPFPGALKACDVADSTYFRLGDIDASLTIQSEGKEEVGADYAKVACVLQQLEVPDSVVTRMDTTRALDGRQSAHWKDLEASWTYHPDNGMNLLVELASH